MGMVWLYAKRALLEIMDILSQPEAEANPLALDEEFSASLRTELEGLFAGEGKLPSSPKPQPRAAPPRSSTASSDSGSEDRAQGERGAAPSSLSFQEARERGLIPPDLLAELDPSEPDPPKEGGHAS